MLRNLRERRGKLPHNGQALGNKVAKEFGSRSDSTNWTSRGQRLRASPPSRHARIAVVRQARCACGDGLDVSEDVVDGGKSDGGGIVGRPKAGE
ncbi:hypothetical protein F4827_001066 [Paraburkholderia bannensis]|uniref:Uncharacterized protein n=1 Tax=Paraburkholderia bannensis TaxID=765414 RepID=A0A7W9TVR6_9BURK|nr:MULTISPECIES: hypothetical protein [Paraburkholderia]MBB3256240.1 hypothetical protein [Paraburkholderia sp. WP4_3_2]MBB6101240.1 hypothetical protein [Paraburkholderia bannensis]